MPVYKREMNFLSKKDISQEMLASILSEERPITVDEACDIRLLLFGNTVDSFSDGWTQQGFKFKRYPPYGLSQKRSGPCGVIAAVQAYVLYELLFGYSRLVLDDGLLRPGDADRKEALARAIANILWQAGNKKTAIVAKKYDKVVFDDSVTSTFLEGDGILEYVKLKCFRSLDNLLQHLYNFIQDITKEGGCILFLYSIILTHGIDKIKEEMDCPDSHLIGGDGYCSQEVVNLILVGKAVPNLFNGDVELNSGNEETALLKGIPKQSKIGFLSLYEYQEACTVGSYYKDPEYPIWVLWGESHFTVLFGTSRDILINLEKTFKLYYSDSFSPNNEVSFTIYPSVKLEPSEKDRSLPIPVRCIHTRWPLAEVDIEATKKS